MPGAGLGSRGHNTCWQVRNTHPGLAGVAMLTTGTGTTEIINAKVVFIHMKFGSGSKAKDTGKPLTLRPSPFTLFLSHATR